MNRFILIALSLVLGSYGVAQVPTSCFEIESILVDACAEGSSCGDNSDPACLCEGKNEMFRFVVGPDDLDVGDMYIDWPNGGNPWQGVCQNGNTADIIEELNDEIFNCGHLLEPENDILPAGSNVLMITSTDMCVTANSFAGLADTLIVIFQCTGNFYGHFANQSVGSNNLRTIEVDFGAGCYEEATYDRSILVDQNGDNNAEDGARVDFTWNGDPSYHNDGCNAPIEQAEFNAGPNAVLCPGEEIELNPLFSSDYASPFWSGGTGTFVDANDPNTSYIPSGDEPAEFTLEFNATGCNGIVTDEITVTNLSTALTGIESSLGTTICQGEITTLTATGDAGIYQWSTGPIAPSIEVDEPGEYTVSVTNACGTTEESIVISVADAPEVNILNPDLETICVGSSVQLDATLANGDFEWSTMDVTPSIDVSAAGWYYATVTNDCATVVDSVEVIVLDLPEVSITPQGVLELCEGSSLELTAIGDIDDQYTWSTDETEHVITINEVGTYTVTVVNDCGEATDEVEVVFGGSPPTASITYADDLLICPEEDVILMGAGDGDYVWNGTAGSDELSVYEPGLYTLEVINECGSDETSVEVLNDEIPEAFVDGATFALCDENAITIEAYGTGAYTWFNGFEGNLQTFGSPGDYFVVATAACGNDTAFFEVISDPITATLDADPLEGESPLIVNFDNLTSNAATVFWIFDEGVTAFGQSTQYTFTESGIQEVIMQVTSPGGCVDEASVFLSVGLCPFSLFVPSSFTPDGDWVNDQLRVEGNCIAKFEWQIYDRWGRAVYESNDVEEQWNGADVSGYAVSNGVYPYLITVTDQQAETHRFTGSITVIR